ncbi:catalase-A-like [Bicyclus anynana]|uniref:Catalase-A-like n=1 Tax=Bicyclus anynana TaxID=110368 RepID=A0ABM3LHN4_BICAN|nr:catalase-A-like [Bicyclus anynana]
MAVSVGAMYEEPLDPVGAMYEEPLDPVRDQIQIFKEKTEGPIGVLTTSSGRPVTYCEATSTFNKPLLRNELFMDVVAHLTRERIPERIVHAKGAGAFGYFESTKDISHICKADFLKKGTKTPVENKKFEQYFVRFHFMPDAGIKTLSSEEAVQRGAMDADTLTLDLYRRIANKTYPSWTGPIGVLTTSGGKPITYCEATSTFNTPLVNNAFFMDMMTHLVRERLSERIVHAKGAGAFGYFESTKDISHICKANFLKRGTKTPVALRFSTSRGFRGSSDLDLDVRGFAVKFYTREGNFDVPGFNTPIYLYKEALHSLPFLHTSRRNPATNALDPNMFWDMITLIPESIHMMMFVFSGRGLPESYVNMPGFGIHTYQVENKKKELYFIRFHFLPDAGVKSLPSEVAVQRGAFNADILTVDLYGRIANGTYPSWTVSVQILSLDDVKKEGAKVFDVTRTIPLKKYPLHKIGKIVLDRNPKNYFAEVEQMAFCPSHLVPGIVGAPDKLFESRRLAYRDAQLYRLGGNFNSIPVNCPFQVETHTYNRDGLSPVGDNQRDVPNYYPNSFHGPAPVMTEHCSSLISIVETEAGNFDQAAEVYAEELTDRERDELIKNVVFALSTVVESIQFRALKLFAKIHQDFGSRVEQGLNITMTDKTMKKC